MIWQKQHWRNSPDETYAETEHGVYTIGRQEQGSSYWEVELDRVTIKDNIPTHSMAVNIAMQDASIRDWHTLDAPGGKTPLERLVDAGYHCIQIENEPAYRLVYKVKSNGETLKLTAKEALDKFIDKDIIAVSNPAKDSWTLPAWTMPNASVAETVDATDLKSVDLDRAGSIPAARTKPLVEWDVPKPIVDWKMPGE